MVDYLEQIKEIEAEIKKTPYNKATQHHIGLLKAKIAKLKDAQFRRSSGGKKGGGYSVRKSGDGTVVLLGYPSVGKSTLLNALTGADSEVGSYDFTTLDVIPGVMEYKHAKIQVLDVPGIVRGAAMGTGRGREVLSVLRSADLVVFLVDVNNPEHYPVIQNEAYESGLRINAERPVVKIMKKPKGGLNIGSTVKLTRIEKRTIERILMEFRINNADAVIRTDITAEELIDVIEGNKVYVPGITVLTKIDLADGQTLAKTARDIRPDIQVSAEKGTNVDRLKELIYRRLGFIRVYCKEVGKKADLDVPLILMNGSTVGTMCSKLHRDFQSRFKAARVWGRSAKFPGQRQGKRHALSDGDIVELQMR